MPEKISFVKWGGGGLEGWGRSGGWGLGGGMGGVGQGKGIFFPSMECFLSSLLKHTENPLTGSTAEILHGVGGIFPQTIYWQKIEATKFSDTSASNYRLKTLS